MRSLGSRSSNFPSSFSKQSLPLRGLCFFLVLPCGFVQMHRGSSSRSLRRFSSFSRLPPCVARLPTVQRDVSPKKPRDNSEKRGAIGENTEDFSRLLRSFSSFPTQTRGVSRVHTEFVRGGETSSSDFMHKLRCFLPFSSAGKLSVGTFRLHSYSFHPPLYNKTHPSRKLSQQFQNSKPRIPTCSDCPRTILYLISHFKNFSL